MSDADRDQWNWRYAERALTWEPSSWLVSIETAIRPGGIARRALDVACGNGKNAIWLARLGYAVDAWDISDVGLRTLQDRLAELMRDGAALDVRLARTDLDTATIPPNTYDLILDTFFLDRRLFPLFLDGLRPGGVLVFETFADLGATDIRSIKSEYKLGPGELAAAFRSLDVLHHDEDAERGTARLFARRR